MSVEATNWSDFVAAVGTSGAEVVLPEDALWDMNEILPHFNQNLEISCAKIIGNGTEIKNLHITGFFDIQSAVEIKNIKFTNILADGNGSPDWSRPNGFFNCGTSGLPAMTGCTASGIFGSGYGALFAITGGQYTYWRLNQCAFNCDMQSAVGICSDYIQGTSAHACRFFFDFPSVSGDTSVKIGDLHIPAFNEYVINAPLAEKVYAYGISSCTLRGNLQNVTLIDADGMSETSVYSTESAPNASVNCGFYNAQLIGVTDAQMKSAEYLRGIGFLIGDE